MWGPLYARTRRVAQLERSLRKTSAYPSEMSQTVDAVRSPLFKPDRRAIAADFSIESDDGIIFATLPFRS